MKTKTKEPELWSSKDANEIFIFDSDAGAEKRILNKKYYVKKIKKK